MKIPEKIKIGGKTYTVEITSKMDLGINNVSAEILYGDLIIRVSPQAMAKWRPISSTKWSMRSISASATATTTKSVWTSWRTRSIRSLSIIRMCLRPLRSDAMRVKQYKGTVYGADLTAKERRAMNIEINRQIVEADRKYLNNVDAMILYFLHKHLGFGKKRLRRAWEQFTVIHDDLVNYYEMPDDGAWLADRKLQEIGVDVAAWNAGKDATQ